MKKVLLLGMVLVLCLAAAGIGYAHWSKNLYVDGTVTTGTFGVEWSQGTPYDTETKEVVTPTCSIVDNTLLLLIPGAYPSYEAHFPVDIHGVGSVPADIDDVTVTLGDATYVDPVTLLSVTVPNQWLVVTLVASPLGQQLHACTTFDFEIVIHVEQDGLTNGALCPEGATLGCAVTIVANQYNQNPSSS